MLRRQLSLLQRQVSDIQRTLADKDDELAAEIEKRVAIEASYEELADEQRVQQLKLDELTASSSRLAGVEQRVLDAVTTAEELSRAKDREKELRTQAEAKLEDLDKQLETTFASWKADRASLEDQHAASVQKLEQQKRMASDAAAAALLSATSRMREAHDDELARLRESHVQSLTMLRGELEPKALAALSLAEERQRLADELASTKTEAARAAAERNEAHQREHAELVEQHTLELDQASRTQAAELARVSSARDEHQLAVLYATRNTEQREQYWEQLYGDATDVRARVERDLAEARATIERITAEKASADERLGAAAAAIEKFVDEKRSLRERLELSEGEARRNALDRRRFMSYLETGLAMLRDDDEDPDVTITSDEVEVSGSIDTAATLPAEPSADASGPYEVVPDSSIESQQDVREPPPAGGLAPLHLAVEPEAAPPPVDDFAVTFSAPGHEGSAVAPASPAEPGPVPAKKVVAGLDLDEELGLGPALVAALEAALAPAAAAAAFPTGEDTPPPGPPPRRSSTLPPAPRPAAPANPEDEPAITVSRTMPDSDQD